MNQTINATLSLLYSYTYTAYSLGLLPTPMESSIIFRLQIAEEEIFEAVASDGSSAIFIEKWTALEQDINHALQAGCLSRETQSLVFQTASMISTIAESFLRLQKGYSSLSAQLTADLDEIFTQVCYLVE